MKYEDQLTLIVYKISEIKEDLKGMKKLEERVTKLEKFMYLVIGAITLVTTVVHMIVFTSLGS